MESHAPIKVQAKAVSGRAKYVPETCDRMVGKYIVEAIKMDMDGFSVGVEARAASFKRLRSIQKDKLVYVESHNFQRGHHDGQVFHKFTNGKTDEVGMCACGEVMNWGELMRGHKFCETQRHGLEAFCALQPDDDHDNHSLDSSMPSLGREPSLSSFGEINQAMSEVSLDSFDGIARACSQASSKSCGSSLNSYGNSRSDSSLYSGNSLRLQAGLSSGDDGGRHSVEVHVRVRPPTGQGGGSREGAGIDVGRDGSVRAGGCSFLYPQSVVLGTDQDLVFQRVASSLLGKLERGYSVSLLAYGQTGSGKTHTMFGPPGSLSEAALEAEAAMGTGARDGVPDSWGVFPRCMMHLLRLPNFGSMHVSAVEVYQEQAFDLIDGRAPLKVGKSKNSATGRCVKIGEVKQISGNSGSTGNQTMEEWKAAQQAKEQRKKDLEKRREAAQAAKVRKPSGRYKGNTAVQRSGHREPAAAARTAESNDRGHAFATVGETLQEIRSDADVARLARRIEATRAASGHALNARSSRSHCLVHVYVVTAEGGMTKKKEILFCDLAGSERIQKSGVEGTMRDEALCINGSLSALGKVIKQLGEGTNYVSYRDSTLTMLLKSSFGGRSCTSVVINVSGDAVYSDETVASLRFGQRMTWVRNNATVVVGKSAEQEVARAEADLKAARRELAAMEKAGAGLRFGSRSDAHLHDGSWAPVQSEIDSYLRNLDALSDITKSLLQAKELQTEYKAQEHHNSYSGHLEDRIKQLEFEEGNMKMIILRQQSIKGFVHQPTKSYLRKKAEIKELEGGLSMLTGNGSVGKNS
jgi:hypothetical protein